MIFHSYTRIGCSLKSRLIAQIYNANDENQTSKIKDNRKKLKSINKELEKLVDLALSGTLNKSTIHKKEQELIQCKEKLTDHIQADESRLNSLPDIDEVKTQASEIRRKLLKKFSSNEHIDNMSFDEKRELLYWLFGGHDNKGTKYGIYINKKGEGKDAQIDHFMFGRITGLRTLKGDDIDYFEEKDNYKTINVARNHKDRKQADLQPGMA